MLGADILVPVTLMDLLTENGQSGLIATCPAAAWSCTSLTCTWLCPPCWCLWLWPQWRHQQRKDQSGHITWDLLLLRATFWILTSSTLGLGPCDHKGGVNGVTVKVGA